MVCSLFLLLLFLAFDTLLYRRFVVGQSQKYVQSPKMREKIFFCGHAGHLAKYTVLSGGKQKIYFVKSFGTQIAIANAIPKLWHENCNKRLWHTVCSLGIDINHCQITTYDEKTPASPQVGV